MPDGDYRAMLPYAVFGFSVKNNRISDAAPIAKWAIGKNAGYYLRWLYDHGGTFD